MAALTEQELARLKEINAELDKRKNKTQVYKNLEAEANAITKKKLEYEKELNRQYDLGVKTNKITEGFARKAKKSAEEAKGSLVSRLQNLAKGNLLQAVSLDFLGKATRNS